MKKSIVIYAHIIFWIALIATRFFSTFLVGNLSVSEYGLFTVYITLMSPLFFYVGYLFVMKIKWRSKYMIYIIFGIIIIYLILFLISIKAFAYSITPLSSFFLWATIGSLFRYFIDWFKKRNDVLILEKENVSSNLAVLKNQINPHFLFNTLHNIDALIYENQDKASKSLVKLSDIMRYMLKDTQSDFVELKNEIEYLENYLSLEQLRLKTERFLNYSLNGNYDGMKIAPMILISFVENAFKHSVDSNIENGIIIKISIENKKLFFVCENRFDQYDTDKDKGHGIGLETVRKRLSLIYKNKHNLTINSDNSVFIVNLEIELNEN